MTRFTDSPYEKMMQQVPTERRGGHGPPPQPPPPPSPATAPRTGSIMEGFYRHPIAQKDAAGSQVAGGGPRTSRPSAHSPLPRLSLPPGRALSGDLLPKTDEKE